eukprot:gnl/MRDRNA2_/MRDRNA2_84285_c0_seq5.p1 gnl/MRDRNA2_/MRDRNA2_84285_c0~~gnl/MRDRNA2_/MRDRNA2_84285_c0_seq5.p1  ORF type:complete len:200 (+),score=13.52 gnl/MRDRNA2_/MRDRNA2_84285_c0_seq5:92-601(+)
MLTSTIALQSIQWNEKSCVKYHFEGRYPHSGESRVGMQRISMEMLEMAANSSHSFDASVRADNKGLVIRRFHDRSVSLRHLSQKIGQWALESVNVAIDGLRVGTWTAELMPHNKYSYAVSDFRIPRVACGVSLRRLGSNHQSLCQIAITLSTTHSSIWSTAGYDIYSLL